ncbi:hypothetical protein ACFY1U_33845 [Streptomyces sp. NPDC001351]|uniref:hypothetical protein n=1 Tax=Streptomyces sp. NPDC001351 TaxID=3364564 RepID=UPI0036B7369B
MDDDKDSPAAVGGSGCLCYRTFMDPEFGLPVIAHRYRTVGGNTDQWGPTRRTPRSIRGRMTSSTT